MARNGHQDTSASDDGCDVLREVKTRKEAALYKKGIIVPGSHPESLWKIISRVERKLVHHPKGDSFYLSYRMKLYDAVAEEMRNVWAD